MPQELRGLGVSPALVAGREMAADIASRDRAEDGVRDRVEGDVRV